MSDAAVIEVADNVVAVIAEETFSLPFESVERCYVPELNPETLQSLRCYVIPGNEEGVRSGRGSFEYDYVVRVGIAVSVESAQNVVIDPLVRLSQEVVDHFKKVRLNPTGVVLVEAETTPFDPDKLVNESIFASYATLGFSGNRDVV